MQFYGITNKNLLLIAILARGGDKKRASQLATKVLNKTRSPAIKKQAQNLLDFARAP